MGIFDQIGGPPAASAAVDDLYRRVVGDPELTPYVDGVDMKRLTTFHRSFIAAALGETGPGLGSAMREAHSRRDLAPAHFDRVVAHLVETLADLGVRPAIIDRVAGRLAWLRAEVTTRPVPRAS